jgi:hypothetical protein
MSSLKLPKSISDSQKYVSWAFPGLLIYAVAALPESSLAAKFAIAICFLIIVTGWQSFGIVEERFYNDLLFLIDLSLLSCYWLLIYFSAKLTNAPGILDQTVLSLSGTIFFLYAVWNIAAIAGSDTRALATAAHLSRFAWITFSTAILFFALVTIVTRWEKVDEITFAARAIGFSIWGAILLWWQVGKFLAASKDTRQSQ